MKTSHHNEIIDFINEKQTIVKQDHISSNDNCLTEILVTINGLPLMQARHTGYLS